MLRNSRFYILLGSFLLSLLIYGLVASLYSSSIQTTRLSQAYALITVAFLYVTLLIGPLYFTLPNLPYKKELTHARRALGVASFYFGALHGSISFFGPLGGFDGLGFLSDRYIIAIGLSFTALIILFLLTATSFDSVIKKMTFPKWKLLHRLVYLAGFFILIHALMLGSHFRSFSDWIPQIFFAALAVLLLLEANRVDTVIQNKFGRVPRFGVAALLVAGFYISFYVSTFSSAGSVSPFSVHQTHTEPEQAQNMDGMNISAMNAAMAKMPGMDGDKTKRFTTSFLHDDIIEPGQDTTLTFPIYDANSGEKVQYVKILYEKPAHLIIVDSTLSSYAHVHPDATAEGFKITTQFPTVGKYHLYLNYQPLGAIEQQSAFTIQVGEGSGGPKSTAAVDSQLTKTFGNYQVTLDHPQPLQAYKLTAGGQILTFTIKDKAGKPVSTLKPYLAAYGHLVMINRDTYDYIHVHPTNITPPKPDENGGPSVQFTPMGLFGTIKPGIYRVFAQFNPNNELFTADFTIEIK